MRSNGENKEKEINNNRIRRVKKEHPLTLKVGVHFLTLQINSCLNTPRFSPSRQTNRVIFLLRYFQLIKLNLAIITTII